MAEELNKDDIIKEYLHSKEFIDLMNAEKGKWAADYQKSKIPELKQQLMEEVKKELNPEETEAEKRIRLIEEELRMAREEAKRKDEELAKKELQQKLVSKASELGIPPERAAKYVVYGEEAETVLAEDAEYYKSFVTSEIEKMTKEKFNSKTPDRSDTPTGKLTIQELKGKSVEEIRQLKSKGLIEGL